MWNTGYCSGKDEGGEISEEKGQEKESEEGKEEKEGKNEEGMYPKEHVIPGHSRPTFRCAVLPFFIETHYYGIYAILQQPANFKITIFQIHHTAWIMIMYAVCMVYTIEKWSIVVCFFYNGKLPYLVNYYNG